MDNIINRKQIANGIHFSFISDPRYKVNRISVNFFLQLSEKAGLTALIPRLLSSSNQKFPDRKLLNEKKASLYSAKVEFNISNVGDSQLLELYAFSIDNKYALSKGEDVTGEVTDILLECIFNPVLKDGLFLEEKLAEEKKALIEAIEAGLNDKREYARKRLYETFYEGEPAAFNYLGKVDTVKEATSKAVTDIYHELIKSAPIEIFAIGCNDFKSIGEKLKEVFGSIKRENLLAAHSNPSPIKKLPVEKTEKMAVEQSKMVLGFKTSSRNAPAVSLMSMIFGGMTSSKLFTVVREKMSLCYYCWSTFSREKRVMIVDSGVEGENIEKAKAAIIDQLKSVTDGDFTITDIETAKLTIANNYKSINDSPVGIINWYITRIYRSCLSQAENTFASDDECPAIKSPEQTLLEFEGITKEDIMAEAKLMTLDTTYILTSRGN